MKFITEDELRDLYKIQPFMDYDLPEGERLTPGARQFLLDRGIDLYDRNDPYATITCDNRNAEKSLTPAVEKKKRILSGKMKEIQISFLLTAKELLDIDACMAQQLIGLCRQFAALRGASEGICEVSELRCSACTGINEENFCESLGDCFEITEFHMQMPKSRQMLILAKLRAELQILDIEIEDLISDSELYSTVSKRINRIINTLSQMICAAMGGQECQRTD